VACACNGDEHWFFEAAEAAEQVEDDTEADHADTEL